MPTAEELRNKQQLYYDEVDEGQEMSTYVIGPMTPTHLFRWSAAIENWHRIHYDETFTKEHEKLPERLVNGSWKQHVMVQMMKDWAGVDGWLWKIGFQFRKMDQVGQTVTAWGKVTDKRQVGDYGSVEGEIGLRNDDGQENSTPGTATVVLPLRGGKPVPYPFVPPEES